ncbi:MAG: hypothetical protein ACRENQ_04315, partial [Gemmatimonadaceae bacterium]
MSHLSPERLAALADEEPTAPELAHLTACSACTAEREAQRTLLELTLAERTSIGLPLTRWESLSSALVEAGLVTSSPSARHVNARGAGARIWLQVAAALMFVAGGTMFGRYTAGAAPLPGLTAGVAQLSPAPDTSAAATFHDVNEARAARTRAQAVYQNASVFLAQYDTAATGTESPSAMRTRLAALDQVSTAMRQALNDAPYDPVINDYYLTTLG